MNNFFYYIFVSSVILIYGLSLDRIVVNQKNIRSFLIDASHLCLFVFPSVLLIKFLLLFVLIPNRLTEFCPFVSVFILLIFYITANLFLFKSNEKFDSVFSISFLFIFLSISESSNIIDALLISAACIISLLIIQVLLISLQKRFHFSRPSDKMNKYSLIFINISIIMIALCTWNISWLNPGLIK